MIFYRKDLTTKIMSRTHMLFLKLQYFTDTHTHTSIFRRFPHNSPKGAIIPTRLHPRGKGGPFGALVWKTFKSLRSETSDQRYMDLIVSKRVKNVIL